MKVAFFQFFPPTLWTPGGGETLLAKTREALLKLGLEVELFDIWSPKRDYDIIHVFGSSYQLSDFVVAVKQLGMHMVVTPLANTDKPAWQWRLWRHIDTALPISTTFTYRKRICEAADLLLACSEGEADQLHAYFSIPREKMVVLHNAAERRFAEASPGPFVEQYGLKNFVLMVSRINKRKGQLRLIHALDGLNLQLVFIGQADPDAQRYFHNFIAACQTRPWVRYLGWVPHGILVAAYAAAKVHALPSPAELPGLASLEAGLAGANVVAVKDPPVYEHLGGHAFYCDPRSLSSIQNAVLEAYNAPRSEGLRKRLLAGFTWDVVAEKMLAVYERLLAEK